MVLIIEQFLMLILIIGRWMLPKVGHQIHSSMNTAARFSSIIEPDFYRKNLLGPKIYYEII
jgi:hypothetical protein